MNEILEEQNKNYTNYTFVPTIQILDGGNSNTSEISDLDDIK